MAEAEDIFFQNLGVETEKDEPQPEVEETTNNTPTEEAPAQEAPKVENVPENNEKPLEKPEEPKQEVQPSASAEEDETFEINSDEDLAKFASEHFGKDISVEKLKSILEDKVEVNPFANDTVKEVNEYLAGGGDLKDFIEFKMTDFTQMSDLDIVKKKMQADYPSLSKEQIDRRLTRQFKLDEDRYDEEEIEDGKIDLSVAAQEGRKHFTELQSKYASPLQTKVEAKAEEPQFSEEQLQQFNNQMTASINNLKTIEVNGIRYEVDDALRNKVSQSPTDIGDMFLEGDKFNFDKYNQFRAIAVDPERFAKTLYEQGQSDALKKLKEERNNTQLEPEAQNPDVNVDSKKATESLLQHYAGGGKRYGF